MLNYEFQMLNTDSHLTFVIRHLTFKKKRATSVG
jgi:hypothetical protein